MDEKQCEGPCYSTVVEKNPPCPLQCGTKSCKSYKDRPKVDLRDHVIVWMYGGPSSGKTVQTQNVVSTYGYTRLNVGELLTREIKSGSVRAKCLQNAVDRGELVPNDVVIMLLKREIEAIADKTPGFVIDGFPREERQGMLFENSIAPATIFIFLDVEKKTLMDRHGGNAKTTKKRWPTEMRNDNCVAGKLQIHIFYSNHKHIVDQYPHKVVRINAERTPQEIFEDIKKELEKVIKRKKEQALRRKQEEEKWKALEPKPKPSVPL